MYATCQSGGFYGGNPITYNKEYGGMVFYAIYQVQQNIAFYFLFLIKIFLVDWGEDMFLQLNTYVHSMFNIIYTYT